MMAGKGITDQGILHEVKDRPGAPDFNLLDLDETRHSLSAYRGKVVVINFWASWCPPCRFELPSMQRAYIKLQKEGVVMLAINVGEDVDTIFAFTADYPVTFPLLLDRDSSVTQAYPVVGLPTTFVVDPQGRLVYRAIGTREWDEPNLIKKILSLQK
jgi:peroxiredoxin